MESSCFLAPLAVLRWHAAPFEPSLDGSSRARAHAREHAAAVLRDVKVRRRNLSFPLYLTQSGTEQGCGGWRWGGSMRGERVEVKQSGNVAPLLLPCEEPTSSLDSA